MEYVEGKDFKYKNTAITLGKFDGIHRGHQMLLKKVISLKEKGLTSVMFTFASHPQSILQHKQPRLIYTLEEKRILLDNWGLDVLVSYPFNKEVANMKAYDFVKDVLIGQLDAKVIVVGKDFHFGHNREGNIELLEELAKEFNFELIVFDKLEHNDRRVSSTLIKELITEGEMEKANHLLGTPYTIVGKVKHGKKLGRTLGFPTTNIVTDKIKILPPNGVYASNTKVDGKMIPGVTSIGKNPTVGKLEDVIIETFLFDFDGDLYDQVISVQILSKFRPEIKFDSKELLKQQVDKDIVQARQYFNLD